MLNDHPDWLFVHLSRYPAPTGLVNPERSYNTSALRGSGGPIYQKAYGTSELAQAMLCHTDFAAHVTNGSVVWDDTYAGTFAYASKHVLYPSVIQRLKDDDLSSPDSWAPGTVWLRTIVFTQWIYTTFDFINTHAPWFTLFLTPVVTIACLTNDWMISLTAIAVLFITCWACGIR